MSIREAAQAVVDATWDREDAINALRAALAEPEWIPVSEPPEAGKDYLILFSNGMQDVGTYGWHANCFYDECNRMAFSGVTHWRPLPEPPGEE